MCPTNATLEPPTVNVVNVPEPAVNVEAVTFVVLNDAVPVTFMSPNVAVDALISSASTLVAVKDADATTRFVKVPVSLVIVDEVNPDSSGCVWFEDANAVVSKSVISDMTCVCPTRATLVPFTWMSDAMMLPNVTCESVIETSPVTTRFPKVAVEALTELNVPVPVTSIALA